MKILRRGFTLIELLVVIAVLGVLITIVVLAIDPVQQLAKGRDAGRLAGVQQIGNALLSYSTTNNNAFPTAAQWTTSPYLLVTSGEMSSIPVAPTTGVTACTKNIVTGYCYNTNVKATDPVILYTPLEAKTNVSKCSTIAATALAWALFSSADGRSGIVCTLTGTEPAVPAAGATEGVCAANPCATINKFLQQ